MLHSSVLFSIVFCLYTFIVQGAPSSDLFEEGLFADGTSYSNVYNDKNHEHYLINSQKQLTRISSFDAQGYPIQVEQNFWEGTKLLARTVADGQGIIQTYQVFKYDQAGNIIEEETYQNPNPSEQLLQVDTKGVLLNEKGLEGIKKIFHYSQEGFHLLVHSHDDVSNQEINVYQPAKQSKHDSYNFREKFLQSHHPLTRLITHKQISYSHENLNNGYLEGKNQTISHSDRHRPNICHFCKKKKCKCKKGPTGPTGPAGIAGTTGATGPTGPAGTVNDAWLTTGNAGTNPAINFLGTTDNNPIIIAANTIAGPRILITEKGQIETLDTGASVFVGEGAGAADLIGTGINNVFIGFQAGAANTTTSNNTAIGFQTLLRNTVNNNTAIGSFALTSNTTGINNTAIGTRALTTNISGNNNTAMGLNSLRDNTTGSNNTAIGLSNLLFNTTGANNTTTGTFALISNTTGSQNTALGVLTLSSNTTGSNNVAVGVNALTDNTTGMNNIAIGSSTLAFNTTANFNTAIGNSALNANITGSENTAIGFNANVSADGLTNATVLGANATVNASNKVRIGNTSVTVIEGQVAFTASSDGRFKTNIKETVPGLSFITKLRPVTYHFDMDQMAAILHIPDSARSQKSEMKQGQILRTGFIAQEVEQVANEIGYDFDAINKPENEQGHYGLAYSTFVVPLVRAVQEQQVMIDDLKNIAQEQQMIIHDLKNIMQKQQERIDQLEGKRNL